MSVVFRTLIGAVFGFFCAFALSPAIAALHSDGSNFASVSTIVIVAIMAALGYFAPTVRRAFGRGFLLLGLCFFALPFSAMLLSGRAASEVVAQASADGQAAAVLGAGAAGLAVTGIATFIGLIAGAIFVILGLVLALGGRREVIVVTR
ncbi:hypothetical protein [Paracoccus aminophilus]|uniref:hypothetical protein n=1 Tax=Paracoccus aminophilus TaxID=34003 RepID=UPI0011DC97AC|nr:hypothetical protein [Paracoccus aminophilus]